MSEELGSIQLTGETEHRHLAFRGEFDRSDVERHENLIAYAMQGPPQMLSLHLGEVTFGDSSFVGLLLALHHAVVSAGGKLTVESVSPAVARVLEITGIKPTLER